MTTGVNSGSEIKKACPTLRRTSFSILIGMRTEVWEAGQKGFFPQQLPGPAQPAWLGVDPQQAVSPGPGMLWLTDPDMDEWAERSFFIFKLPQAEHLASSSAEATRISLVFPHSRHK